jgi:hypothetical protein
MYVDDFVLMVHDNSNHHQQVKRSLFVTYDSVFWSLLSTTQPDHQEPTTLKNTMKGDNTWTMADLVGVLFCFSDFDWPIFVD